MTDLVALLIDRIGQDVDGECHLTEAEAREAASEITRLRGLVEEAKGVLGLVEKFERATATFRRAISSGNTPRTMKYGGRYDAVQFKLFKIASSLLKRLEEQ